MDLTNRLYPHPVLSGSNDDYPECKFTASVESTSVDRDSLLIEISFENDCPGMTKLITERKAKYAVRVECPSTHYRAIELTDLERVKVVVPRGKAKLALEINPVIVAASDFNLKLPEFNHDYDGMDFKLSTGDILGVAETLSAELEDDLHWSVPSIFEISVDDSQPNGHYGVDIAGDRIVISVDRKSWDAYKGLKGDKQIAEILSNIIVMPALTYAVERVLADPPETDLEDLRWFRAIRRRIEEKGIDGFAPDVANRLMEGIIGSSLYKMQSVAEGD